MNRHVSHIVQQEPSLLEAELKLEPDEWIDFPDLDCRKFPGEVDPLGQGAGAAAGPEQALDLLLRERVNLHLDNRFSVHG